MQKNLKMQFIKDFAGKKKGFVGEYSKDNAVILIKNGIAAILEESTKKAKEKPKKED